MGKDGTIVGWGKDEHGNQFVEEPKQLKVPIVSHEGCLRSDERFLKLTSNRTFCAGTFRELFMLSDKGIFIILGKHVMNKEYKIYII